MVAEFKALDVAKKLFLKFGVKSVTMDDISKEAGVSKKTIYNVVSNKAELIDFVVERHIQSEQVLIEAIREEATDALDEMVKITEHIIYFLRIFRPSLSYELKKYYKTSWDKVENKHFTFIQEVIFQNIKRGKEEGIYRKDLDEDIVSKIYLQVSHQLVNEDLFPIKTFPKVTLFKHFISYHLHGILNEKGLKQYKAYK